MDGTSGIYVGGGGCIHTSIHTSGGKPYKKENMWKN
jgi:hypothetical protein